MRKGRAVEQRKSFRKEEGRCSGRKKQAQSVWPVQPRPFGQTLGALSGVWEK